METKTATRRRRCSTGGSTPTQTQAAANSKIESIPLSGEQHTSPRKLAVRWDVSSGSIRSIFKDEPGVIIINRPETLHKRAYSTMKIPESVVERVHIKLRAA